MQRKIFLFYMVLIVIGVSVTGFFTSEVAQKYYKYEVEEKLKNTATLIGYEISGDTAKGISVDYNQAAKKYAAVLNKSSSVNSSQDGLYTRITFVDFTGRVVGESETDYLKMENHLNRKEIQEAIQGRTGEDIRFSRTLKINFLYIAIPIKDNQIIVRVSVPLVQLKKIDEMFWYYTVIGILAGLFLTVLLALKFSSTVIYPVKELISVSREISHGNYSKRVNIRLKDELGQLADTFNEMTDKLEKTVEDLKDKNIKVESIINSMISGIIAVDKKFRVILINAMAREMFCIDNQTEAIGINIIELIRNNSINTFLKKTIGKSISAVNEIVIGPPEDKVLRIYTNPIKSKDSLSENSGGIVFIQDITNIKKLEQIRTEFVSNVTHELKTPLTSIRGFIETLRYGAIDDREVAEKFLEIIDIEAERLYTLINDILQLSEIETKEGGKDSNIEIYNLKSIVYEIISILQVPAGKKGVKISAEIDENISILANRDRIKQMLINLIDNGIKYNVENGNVSIKAYRSEGKIIITVKDTGIGIAEEHLSRIFERFYRVDRGRSRNMGGTGLGLSIVKHIVNLYNGDIRVNSTTGKGTEFIIRLPL